MDLQRTCGHTYIYLQTCMWHVSRSSHGPTEDLWRGGIRSGHARATLHGTRGLMVQSHQGTLRRHWRPMGCFSGHGVSNATRGGGGRRGKRVEVEVTVTIQHGRMPYACPGYTTRSLGKSRPSLQSEALRAKGAPTRDLAARARGREACGGAALVAGMPI